MGYKVLPGDVLADPQHREVLRVREVLGWHCLSNAACPIQASFVFMRASSRRGPPPFAILFATLEEDLR